LDFRADLIDQSIAVLACVIGWHGQFGGGSVKRKGLHRAGSRGG